MNTSLANGWINDALTIHGNNICWCCAILVRAEMVFKSKLQTIQSREKKTHFPLAILLIFSLAIAMCRSCCQGNLLSFAQTRLEKPQATSVCRNLSYTGWKREQKCPIFFLLLLRDAFSFLLPSTGSILFCISSFWLVTFFLISHLHKRSCIFIGIRETSNIPFCNGTLTLDCIKNWVKFVRCCAGAIAITAHKKKILEICFVMSIFCIY